MSGNPFGPLFIKDDPEDPNAWRLKGACRSEDPELFFPVERNAPAHLPAKGVCGRCPVILPCRREGMLHDEAGVWGGLSEYERRAIKKRYSERQLKEMLGDVG